MQDNHLEEALVAIRRVMRATEINSLSLAKKSHLTPTQHIVLKIIASKKHATPTHISYVTTLRYTTIATVIVTAEAAAFGRATGSRPNAVGGPSFTRAR